MPSLVQGIIRAHPGAGYLFKKLWHEIKKLFAIGINFEVLFLVLIDDLPIGCILLEEELRDLIRILLILFICQ